MARAELRTPYNKQEERYSDFLMNFDKNPVTGNLARATDEDAVKEAIRNLVLTNKGERFYNFDIGSKLKAALFEPADITLADLIRTTISQTITYHEPRVHLIDVQVFDDPDNNAYKVNIFFNIINIPDVIQLDLLLKRAR